MPLYPSGVVLPDLAEYLEVPAGEKRKDTILAHTLARVLIADGVTRVEDATKWKAAKAVPKASRITSFIVLWAYAELDLGRELEGIDEYRDYWNESERSAYRRQAELRETWGAENVRPLLEAVKRHMAATEKRLGEKFNVARAMSLQVSI
jgi:hypothetical protein